LTTFHGSRQVLTLLGVTAVIVFIVVVVPKLGSRKRTGFRNLIIVLTANFQASVNPAVLIRRMAAGSCDGHAASYALAGHVVGCMSCIKSIVGLSACSLEQLELRAEMLEADSSCDCACVQIAVLAGQVLLYTCPWWTRMRYYVDLSYRSVARPSPPLIELHSYLPVVQPSLPSHHASATALEIDSTQGTHLVYGMQCAPTRSKHL
jgi:hypothetical protein